MGMFDDITLFMACPKCGEPSLWNFQTKDLESYIYSYHPLDVDWLTREDDGLSCWTNQAERDGILAKASELEADHLKHVEVYGSCPKCEASIRGKLNIHSVYLRKPLFDIEVDDGK